MTHVNFQARSIDKDREHFAAIEYSTLNNVLVGTAWRPDLNNFANSAQLRI